MSRHSAKSTGRSAKVARGTTAKSAKKATNSARGSATSASKKARRPATATKSVRKAPAPVVLEAPSVAPEQTTIVRTMSPPVQPVVPRDVPVHPHKYRVGETVYYTSPSFGRAAASGSYTVVKLLPSDGDDHQYRIKSSGEAFERVAKESQLDRV